MLNKLKKFGPGLLVTAAFIGPGTVTTASVAGANYGFTLLWVIIFSIFATIILQEMTSRLGLISRAGLGEAIRTTFKNPILSILSVILVVAAIAFGNAAFETGNIIGAAIGLEALTYISPKLWALLVGMAAFALLASGKYRIIEGVLIAMVVIMSIVFIITAIIVRPNISSVLTGVFVPHLPSAALIMAIALIGTTVVPYNLFLHSSSVQEKWTESIPPQQALAESRTDTVVSISIGGLITMAIVATAAAAFFRQGIEIKNAAAMANQLEPLLGPAAKYFFAIGLFAAGMTSAVTAPLAAAFATSGVLGWKRNLKDWKFRVVWAAIILIGMIFAMLGKSPITAIVFAQAANGILLPLIAIFLLVVMNQRDLLGDYKNKLIANVLGTIIVIFTAGLGFFQLLKLFKIISP
ncbi:MAG: Nramp family divalent metal transporter [bacterium]|nr:MAG: Nramp family divalent metal transporter [bacterium]